MTVDLCLGVKKYGGNINARKINSMTFAWNHRFFFFIPSSSSHPFILQKKKGNIQEKKRESLENPTAKKPFQKIKR